MDIYDEWSQADVSEASKLNEVASDVRVWVYDQRKNREEDIPWTLLATFVADPGALIDALDDEGYLLVPAEYVATDYELDRRAQ